MGYTIDDYVWRIKLPCASLYLQGVWAWIVVDASESEDEQGRIRVGYGSCLILTAVDDSQRIVCIVTCCYAANTDALTVQVESSHGLAVAACRCAIGDDSSVCDIFLQNNGLVVGCAVNGIECVVDSAVTIIAYFSFRIRYGPDTAVGTGNDTVSNRLLYM